MERNVIIALVLMLIVWLIWSSIFVPKKQPDLQKQTTEKTRETSVEPSEVQPEMAELKQELAKPQELVASESVQTEITEKVELKTIEHLTSKVRFVLSNLGPTITSWQLLEYKEVLERPDPVEMMPNFREPGILIWFDTDKSSSKPDSFFIESDSVPFKFYQRLQDVAVRHEIVPDKDYSLRWNVRVTNLTNTSLKGRIKIRIIEPILTTNTQGFCGFSRSTLNLERAVIYYKESFKSLPTYKVAKFTQPELFEDSVFWAGVDDNYFLKAVASPSPERTRAKIALLVVGDAKLVEMLIELPSRTLEPNADYTESLVLFLGPKKSEVLANFKEKRLDRALNPGWLGAISNAIMWVLKLFYKVVRNYGVSIILLSFVLKVVLYPLTRSSYQSMKKMQEIQPKIQELKNKFGKDKEKFNREVMRLYKEHKINPMGGCFPLLLQFPIFIALYRALVYSIELRHAPFILWIKDLAAPDPYMITPVLMGIAMFASQKLTGTASTDPNAKFMNIFMSIFMVFIFMGMPSGLVIYWLVYNILTIVHQLLMQGQKPKAIAVQKA